MFRLKRLMIEGIKSYYHKTEFEFENTDNFILISGRNRNNVNSSNGSGKSSIFHQLIYGIGLYSRIPKNLVHFKKKYGVIEIDLVDDKYQTHYKIRRTIYKTNTRPSTLEVFKNGVEIDYQRIDFFNTILKNEILGVDYDTYRGLRIFLPEYELLLRKGGTELLRFLEKLVDIDKFDNYYSVQNQIINNNEGEIKKLQVSIEHQKKEIENLKKGQIKYQNIKQIDDQIKNQEEELKSIKYNKDEEKKLNAKKDEIKKQINNIKDKLSSTKLTVKNQEKEIKRLSKLKQESRCPVCFTKIEGNKQVQEEINKIIEMNNGLIGKNKELLNEYNNKLKELEIELNNVNKQIESMNNEKNRLQRLEKQIRDLNKLKNKILKESQKLVDEDIKKREELIKKYEEEIEKIEKDNEIYKQLLMVLSPKSPVRQNILDDLIMSNLKNYLDYYSSFLFDSEVVGYVLEKNRLYVGIKDGDDFKEYSLLSSGEKKKTEIIFLLSLNELMNVMNKVNFNLFVFDEVFDNLDSDSSLQLMEILRDFSIRNNQFFMVTTHKNVFDIDNQTIIQVEKILDQKRNIECSRLLKIFRT